MNSFEVLSEKEAKFKIDSEMFSQSVITKVLYWLSGQFTISSKKEGKMVYVKLYSEQPVADWREKEKNISQEFLDFSMRSIINEETKDIRNILYIKAFANLDDFTEYDITDGNEEF